MSIELHPINNASTDQPETLLLIKSRLDADFENNRKLEISQLFLTCTGNGLTWIHPVVDQDGHLNDKDAKTSNV